VTGAVAVLFALPAVVGTLVFYRLVRAEHDTRERMDREQAERAARQDVDAERDPTDRDRSDRRRNT
jgi:hypothetical protein